MKKLMVSLMTVLFCSLQITAQTDGKWQKGYFEDEFGDKLMDQPFYMVNLKAEGKGTFGDWIEIRVSNVFGIEFNGRLTQMMGIRIKTSDGKVHDIPYEVTQNRTYKVANEATQTVFNILSKGNFAVSLVGGGTNADGNIHEILTARVYDETKGIERYFQSKSGNPNKSSGNQSNSKAQGLTFKGTVGKYGIVVYIEPYTDGSIKGWCYYTSQGPNKKIFISGNHSGNLVTFSEYEGNIGVGYFSLNYNKSTRSLSGKHFNINTNKELKVELKQTSAM